MEGTKELLRRLEGMTLERVEQMLMAAPGGAVDSQDLKRLLSAAKDLRELGNDTPGREEGLLVKLEGEMGEFAM